MSSLSPETYDAPTAKREPRTVNAIRMGAGAGYSGDRIEPAVELVERGNLDYLVFECLAERTIALAQQAKLKDPGAGFDPLLVERMEAVLAKAHQQKTKLITNMGAANPVAAAKAAAAVARRLKLNGLRIVAVTGDDVLDYIKKHDAHLEETGAKASALGQKLISANVYLGITPIIEALAANADIIITGRVADSALFLAPLAHEFHWSSKDWERLGRGTLVGHLLECAGQITGGYFADPGYKDVSDLARLGFPIAEVDPNGNAIITKVPGSGGQVSVATCTEQLLYEIQAPDRYLVPDVTADFSAVRFREVGHDRIQVQGGTGTEAPETLKVSVGYQDGFIGEGQISYAGPGALARARLAAEIVKERLALTGVHYEEIRFDFIGLNSLHGSGLSQTADEPYEIRLRVAARCLNQGDTERIGREVEALYTSGPAGGGGATRTGREIVAIGTAFIPRTAVVTQNYLEEV
jgi:Acyclic terpene utilisation family protein AtuA